MSDVMSPSSPGADKTLQAIAAHTKAHDRVLDQPEAAKEPVGLPMGSGPHPFRVKGSAGGA